MRRRRSTLRPLRSLGCLLAALALAGPGCTDQGAGSSDSGRLTLQLADGSAGEARVGQTTKLAVSYEGQGDGDAVFGAMMATPDEALLTQWHVEPEGAATVDGESSVVTFLQPGGVRVWATWSDGEGGSFESNALSFQVEPVE
jgi:hypothetical protein